MQLEYTDGSLILTPIMLGCFNSCKSLISRNAVLLIPAMKTFNYIDFSHLSLFTYCHGKTTCTLYSSHSKAHRITNLREITVHTNMKLHANHTQ